MTFLLCGTTSLASANELVGVRPWQVQVHDDVRVSVRVQCSAEDSAAVAVHLVDPLSRGSMYTAIVDAGSSAMSAGPTSNLIEGDPVYYFLDFGRSAGARGAVTVAMTKGLGTDETKNVILEFDRPGIDCAPEPDRMAD